MAAAPSGQPPTATWTAPRGVATLSPLLRLLLLAARRRPSRSTTTIRRLATQPPITEGRRPAEAAATTGGRTDSTPTTRSSRGASSGRSTTIGRTDSAPAVEDGNIVEEEDTVAAEGEAEMLPAILGRLQMATECRRGAIRRTKGEQEMVEVKFLMQQRR